MIKRKKLVLLGALILLLIAGVGAGAYLLISNLPKDSEVAVAQAEQSFATGSCSDELLASLQPMKEAKNIELLGACYAYRNDLAKASEAYSKAAAAYEKEGNKQKSSELTQLSASLKPAEVDPELGKLLQQNKNPELEGGL